MNAREHILADIRQALQRPTETSPASLPATARVAPRVLGDPRVEMEMLFGEITKLGGITRRLSIGELDDALRDLVQAQQIRRATCWQTSDLATWQVEARLARLGVQLVSPHADKYELAECDLGVTGVDFAFPETGTLMLRSSPEKPRAVSLLPRVHLALMLPTALCADTSVAFAQARGEGYWVFVTGPSRTADIELTVTIGVHGPQALYVWAVE
ncbi:MAG: LUD domain-containing protein [Anaerolineae bacterium]|nr:LUD domain-containing protein [Anaerolineae bacterium]